MQIKKRLLPENDTSLDGILLSNNKGSLVVIAHGYGGKPDGFIPLAENLSGSHDVLLYAQRGHRFVAGKSEGIFQLEKAIEDQGKLLSEFSSDYNRIGCFGFSAGATIAAYACENIDALYLANPFLDVCDLRYFGSLISLTPKLFSYSVLSLGNPRLQDANIGCPVRVALAQNDTLIRNRSANYKAKFGAGNIITVPGNHCFNNRGDTYLGKEAEKVNAALYDDVKNFFSTHL